MRHDSLVWPGLALSLKVLNRERAKVARCVRTLDDNPKAFKRPTIQRTKWKAMLADLDTGAKCLRDVQRAMETPRKTAKK